MSLIPFPGTLSRSSPWTGNPWRISQAEAAAGEQELPKWRKEAFGALKAGFTRAHKGTGRH